MRALFCGADWLRDCNIGGATQVCSAVPAKLSICSEPYSLVGFSRQCWDAPPSVRRLRTSESMDSLSAQLGATRCRPCRAPPRHRAAATVLFLAHTRESSWLPCKTCGMAARAAGRGRRKTIAKRVRQGALRPAILQIAIAPSVSTHHDAIGLLRNRAAVQQSISCL